jgi:hypothetical protein
VIERVLEWLIVVEAEPGDGPYWARTSDLRLVEPALSQLS